MCTVGFKPFLKNIWHEWKSAWISADLQLITPYPAGVTAYVLTLFQTLSQDSRKKAASLSFLQTELCFSSRFWFPKREVIRSVKTDCFSHSSCRTISSSLQHPRKLSNSTSGHHLVLGGHGKHER